MKLFFSFLGKSLGQRMNKTPFVIRKADGQREAKATNKGRMLSNRLWMGGFFSLTPVHRIY